MKINSKFIDWISRTLAALLLITFILKWRILNFIWPVEVAALAILGSSLVGAYVLGSIIGALGLFMNKWWGCVAAYCAVAGATMIGISVIPGVPGLVPVGFLRTYAVFGLNAAVIFIIVFVQIRLRHSEKALRAGREPGA